MKRHGLGWADLHRLADRKTGEPLRDVLLAAGIAMLVIAALSVLFLVLERSEPWTK